MCADFVDTSAYIVPHANILVLKKKNWTGNLFQQRNRINRRDLQRI